MGHPELSVQICSMHRCIASAPDSGHAKHVPWVQLGARRRALGCALQCNMKLLKVCVCALACCMAEARHRWPAARLLPRFARAHINIMSVLMPPNVSQDHKSRRSPPADVLRGARERLTGVPLFSNTSAWSSRT